jgi:hypothetical protein
MVHETSAVGDERLHDEHAPGGQALRHVVEAAHLGVLGCQIEEAVEHHEDQIERAVDGEVGEVADPHRDSVTTRLRAQLRDHRCRGVDAVHRQAPCGER